MVLARTRPRQKPLLAVWAAALACRGSLPVRGDVDLSTANDCMKKGLEILATGDAIPDVNQLISSDTRTQIEELFVEFFADASITPEDAQARFADIISDAD